MILNILLGHRAWFWSKSHPENGICVYFTDINPSCSKGSYLLPKIDRMVDDSLGYHLLNFLDYT